MKMFHDLPRHLRGHRRAAGMNFVNRLDQSVVTGVLQQITAGARAQRIKNAVAVFVSRQHQDAKSGQFQFEFGDTFDAAHAGQIDVHQSHVWFFRRNPRNASSPVA